MGGSFSVRTRPPSNRTMQAFLGVDQLFTRREHHFLYSIKFLLIYLHIIVPLQQLKQRDRDAGRDWSTTKMVYTCLCSYASTLLNPPLLARSSDQVSSGWWYQVDGGKVDG